MPFTNYHTHCRFCDGVGEPREYAEEALRLGMPSLGFSSHAPLPHQPKGMMKLERLPEYADAVNTLKAEYVGRVELYLGLEMDFIPGVTGPRRPWFEPPQLDYRIGSVHYVGEFLDGTLFEVDCKSEKYRRGLAEAFGGDVRKLVAEYYRRVRRMVSDSPPDILAHLDLVKLDNVGDVYFSESEEWYRREVAATIDAVAESEVIVEVNRRSITRERLSVPYPSPWILEKLFAHRIPITISADAHQPEELEMGFADTVRLLSDVGFEEVMVLNNGEWKAVRM